MKITDIQQQVKRKDWFSVFVDGNYGFSLSQSQLQSSEIKIGKTIDKTELASWKNQSEYGKMLDRTLRWLAIRPRSQWELADYLKRKKTAPEEAKRVTEQIKGFGYLDDASFAEAWVASRRALKNTSLRKLRQELLQKHVAPEIIDKVLSNDETNEVEVIVDTIRRKSKQSRYQDKEKLIAYLARQGFNYADIKEALERANLA